MESDKHFEFHITYTETPLNNSDDTFILAGTRIPINGVSRQYIETEAKNRESRLVHETTLVGLGTLLVVVATLLENQPYVNTNFSFSNLMRMNSIMYCKVNMMNGKPVLTLVFDGPPQSKETLNKLDFDKKMIGSLIDKFKELKDPKR